MARLSLRTFVILVAVALLLIGCGGPPSAGQTADQTTPIRIGWQTTWATQGQIVQAMTRTNILPKNGLEGSLVGVSYGAPLNEAALAGEVDVILTADQPAAALLARGAEWEIVARLMFNRVALYVPPESSIQTIAELKGKTIAMPFGAAAQRMALKAIQEAGLDPVKDITAVNLDITEQPAVIQSGSRSQWNDLDAMAGFDPTAAAFEVAGTARMLYVGQVTAVVVMSKAYMQEHPQAPVQFLKALKESIFFYSQNQAQANEWFREASQLSFDDSVLALAASVEPNLKATSVGEVDILLAPDVIAAMQEASDFIFETGLAKNHVTLAEHINLSHAQQATEQLNASTYDPASVQILAQP